MRTETYPTPEPIELFVELKSGELSVRLADVIDTEVRIDGRRADEVEIVHDGHTLSVRADPVSGISALGFGADARLRVSITAPDTSSLVSRLGSADLTVEGRLSRLDSRSGSGDVAVGDVLGDADLKVGSGAVSIGDVGGDLQAKAGSGGLDVRSVGGSGRLTCGSGDVRLGRSGHSTSTRTGSGDVVVDDARGEVALSSGSGSLIVGRIAAGSVSAKNASGDIRVGVAAGTPVWTDVSTLTGRLRSTLETAGAPAEGQDHVEIRATTVSGDVVLEPR